VIWLGLALAGGYEVPYQDVRSGGMGGAGAAVGHPWHNQAGLVGESLITSLSVTLVRSQLRAQALQVAYDAPWESRTENPLAVVPSLGFSMGGSAWAAGLAVNVPFAGGVRWPEDWPRRFEVVSSSTRVFRLSPFVGTGFGQLSIAGGPHINFASLAVSKATNHVSEEGFVAMELAGRSIGVHLSLHVDLEPVDLGLVYRSRSRVSLSGLADFDVPGAFAATYPDQAVSSELVLPDSLVLGLAWGHFRLDVSVMMWSLNEEQVFDFAESEDLVRVNAWQNSVAVRLGAEQPLGPLTVRGGLYLDGLTGPPVPAETLSPASPDSQRIGLTLGAGRSILDHVELNASVEHLRLLQRSSESPDAAQASYIGAAWIVGFGVQTR